MTSIIENNKNEKIEFHIISKYISKENRRIIKQFAIENDININIYIIDETIFNKGIKANPIFDISIAKGITAEIIKIVISGVK